MNNIDHLVYAVADLATGMDEIEELVGVRPAIGGHHPDFGTHNALLSLGPAVYLEIIAPDPHLDKPDRGYPFGVIPGQQSKLATWALRTESIEELAAVANAAGVSLGHIEAGNRQTSDGGLLSWRLTDPYAMPLGGFVPFLISWGKTPHPATRIPHAGDLLAFRIEHPEPAKVRAALLVLGYDVEVHMVKTPRIIATVDTLKGAIDLY